MRSKRSEEGFWEGEGEGEADALTELIVTASSVRMCAGEMKRGEAEGHVGPLPAPLAPSVGRSHRSVILSPTLSTPSSLTPGSEAVAETSAGACVPQSPVMSTGDGE